MQGRRVYQGRRVHQVPCLGVPPQLHGSLLSLEVHHAHIPASTHHKAGRRDCFGTERAGRTFASSGERCTSAPETRQRGPCQAGVLKGGTQVALPRGEDTCDGASQPAWRTDSTLGRGCLKRMHTRSKGCLMMLGSPQALARRLRLRRHGRHVAVKLGQALHSCERQGASGIQECSRPPPSAALCAVRCGLCC